MGGSSASKPAPSIAGLQIQTSVWAKPLPLVYGQTRVACNLIWYGDFQAVEQTESTGGKGGGGGSTTSYTYRAAVAMALCEGPVNAIPNGWANKETFNLSDYNLTAFLGQNGQTPWSYLSSWHPSEAIAYPRVAYVASSYYDLGDSGSLPQHNFEVQGLLYFSTGIAGVPDAAPEALVNDVLTDPYHGAGFPAAKMGQLGQYQAYCKAQGIWLSPAITEATKASDILARWFEITNSAPFFSDGVLKVIPYGDSPLSGNGATFTPVDVIQYAFADDDFIHSGGESPVNVERKAPSDRYNCVQVSYKDRTQSYASNIAEAKDEAAIRLYGLRIAPKLDYSEICDPNVAQVVAHLRLRRHQWQCNTYKWKAGIKYCLLEPMDVVSLTESTGSGLNGTVVRITSVSESGKNQFEFEAEDYFGTVGTTPLYSYQVPGGYSQNYNAEPGSVSAPFIFDAPGRLADTGYEVWIACAGLGPLWGGATVWVSTDGSTYKAAGELPGPSRYGSLTASFAAGGDPDTVNQCAVDLTTSEGVLTSGTNNDANNNSTLCIVDGELIAYSTAQLTATNKYTLKDYIRRGVFGTPIAAHSSGGKFARLDSAIFALPYDPDMIGKTLYFKFTSTNVWGAGAEGLADVPAYTYVIQGPIGAPADVAGFAAQVINDGILLTWDSVATPNIQHYEIRSGASWEAGTFVGRSMTTLLKVPPVSAGTARWWIKAIDKQDRYSINASGLTFTVSAPSAVQLSLQVVDNNVLLSWSEAASTQPILTYEIRRGTTWATATAIGTKTGLFTSIFETVAGTYTYWLAAIDIAGNYGTPANMTATVSAPPDYVLKAQLNSALTGTVSNAKLDQGTIVLPIDTSATFQGHFTGNSWATPQAQIDAGLPVFIEPSVASGYYEETFDVGSIITVGKVVITPTWGTDIGSPTKQTDIAVSSDNISFTNYTNVTSVYATAFRYIKVRITCGSSGSNDVATLRGLNVRVEAKLKSDAGTVAAVSTDSGGTVVSLNAPFSALVAIDCTPAGTTAAFAVANFNYSTVNPTSFQVLLFNASGTRIGGTVNWSVKGY